jgi:hypothetical protein
MSDRARLQGEYLEAVHFGHSSSSDKAVRHLGDEVSPRSVPVCQRSVVCAKAVSNRPVASSDGSPSVKS